VGALVTVYILMYVGLADEGGGYFGGWVGLGQCAAISNFEVCVCHGLFEYPGSGAFCKA